MTPAQLSIFDAPMNRNSDGRTSVQAACVAKANRQKGIRNVLFALCKRGPLADFEIAQRANMHPGSAAKRRLDAERNGDVAATGNTVLTPYGCPTYTWKITAQGRRTLAAMRGEL